MEMLDKARRAVRADGTNRHDEDLQDLIESAKLDLGIAGVIPVEDKLVQTAILTYVRIHFGRTEPAERELLQKSYDLQKAQLQMATGYTDWGGRE